VFTNYSIDEAPTAAIARPIKRPGIGEGRKVNLCAEDARQEARGYKQAELGRAGQIRDVRAQVHGNPGQNYECNAAGADLIKCGFKLPLHKLNHFHP
jgi:hypothetical protein